VSSYTQTFEEAWQRFETRFKGKLLAQANKQGITLSLANLLLKDASSDWFSGYGHEGKWLADYKSEYPDRAKTVTTMLKHELKLTDQAEQKSSTASLAAGAKMKYVLPTTGAVVGAVVASALSLPLVPQLALMALPAAALYPVGKELGKNRVAKNRQSAIDDYLAQLETYKKKILDIIENPE